MTGIYRINGIVNMCVIGKSVEGIFDSLVSELPQGWIATLDKRINCIEIFGPKKAMIFIKPTRKNRASVIGKWPLSSCGASMDPYEWGVLTFNDDYPFTRLNPLQSTKSNISNILSYINAYKSIYNECLDKYALQDSYN